MQNYLNNLNVNGTPSTGADKTWKRQKSSGKCANFDWIRSNCEKLGTKLKEQFIIMLMVWFCVQGDCANNVGCPNKPGVTLSGFFCK